MLWFFGLKPDDAAWRLAARLYVFWFQFIHKGITAEKAGNSRTAPGCFIQKNNKANAGNRVTIIVPVYNAYAELKDCLESVVKKTKTPYRLLIIDDASSDHRIRPLLQAYALEHPHVFIKYNDRNLGYTATINKACELAAPDDVVLLNSDTQVTGGWLAKLSECARSSPRTATVTPLSNAAGVFSIPERCKDNRIPDFLSIDEMGDLVEQLSMRLRPGVPTGNGYCMYVRRRALDVAGTFDEKNFPSGYGEENDFCMRAGRKGFIHLTDDATFIYHQRSASFKGDKKRIVKKSMARLHRLHPEYRYLVLKWLLSDPLDGFRERLQQALDQVCRSKKEKKGRP